MASNTEHQLKLKILQERLANISNDFKGELIRSKRHERKQQDSLHKNITVSSLQQEQPQPHISLTPHQKQSPQQSEPKQPPTQERQQITSKEHLTFHEDLKSEEYPHSLSDEKIFQKTKPNWESWKYIPRKNLDRLKKKTLGYIFKKK